ncbi:hypothetical protein B0H13DRAFT_2018161 [Mycena leptocephala]|nr:hypothetical protein B0H13DRAFT_2018161 [Mycena leptocephala]
MLLLSSWLSWFGVFHFFNFELGRASFPLPCSHPTTIPPRRRCLCYIQLSAWSRLFLFEVIYYGQTFRSNSARKCTDARRLNREPPVPSEFFCAPRLDSTTSTQSPF